LYMFYPDKGIINVPKLDDAPNVENLTIHSPEPIPKSPTDPCEVTNSPLSHALHRNSTSKIYCN
jgi:hypothetical protein